MDHPYEAYEGLELWRVIESAISELEENTDLTLTTAPEYVTGYLCKCITAIPGSEALATLPAKKKRPKGKGKKKPTKG